MFPSSSWDKLLTYVISKRYIIFVPIFLISLVTEINETRRWNSYPNREGEHNTISYKWMHRISRNWKVMHRRIIGRYQQLSLATDKPRITGAYTLTTRATANWIPFLFGPGMSRWNSTTSKVYIARRQCARTLLSARTIIELFVAVEQALLSRVWEVKKP